LSPSEVIEEAKRDGYPEPEKDPKWIEIAASLQPEDQLRVVVCSKSGDTYFYYALIRNDEVISKFYTAILD